MHHFAALRANCEAIANDQKNPSRVVDWACLLYDDLVNRDAMVRIENLELLEAWGEDPQYGIFLIDAALNRVRIRG